jgi:hypothetical protein
MAVFVCYPNNICTRSTAAVVSSLEHIEYMAMAKKHKSYLQKGRMIPLASESFALRFDEVSQNELLNDVLGNN